LALVSAAPRLDARRAVGYVQRAVQDVAQDKPDELGQAIV
jgi:hypothetical protein